MPTAQLNVNGIGSLTSGDVTSEQLDAIRDQIGPLEGLGSLVTPFKIPQNFLLGGVVDELKSRVPGRKYIGQASFYTEGTSGGRFLSAKDINYKEPGDVANFYGMHPSNIFAPGQFLNKFQTEAVKKGVTSGGNAGILADLRSNKNVLGNNPAQAALLRQYLSTGTVPEGLDSQFAINAYDWAIREQGRQQQTKSKGFLAGNIGAIIGTVGGAIIGFVATGFNPAGAIAGAKIGGTLGGAGQAINEKRGFLGTALAAVGGYGVGSLGGSLIGSFAPATAATANLPALAGTGIGRTLVTRGLPAALSQAGTAITQGIGSFGSSLAGVIRHPIQALQRGIGSLGTAFRSPLQTLKGAYGFNVAPAGTTTGLSGQWASRGNAVPGFRGPATITPFGRGSVPSFMAPGAAGPITGAGLGGASLGVSPVAVAGGVPGLPGVAAGPTLAQGLAAGPAATPGLLARGLGAVRDFAVENPLLTTAGVSAGLAGYNALTAPKVVAAEQIPVQPQTGLGTAPPLTGIRSGLPPEQAAPVTDIRVASRYGFTAPPQLNPIYGSGMDPYAVANQPNFDVTPYLFNEGGSVVGTDTEFPFMNFLPEGVQEKFMQYQTGRKARSDPSGSLEMDYDLLEGTGIPPQGQVRITEDDGIGTYFPRSAAGYFQGPRLG